MIAASALAVVCALQFPRTVGFDAHHTLYDRVVHSQVVVTCRVRASWISLVREPQFGPYVAGATERRLVADSVEVLRGRRPELPQHRLSLAGPTGATLGYELCEDVRPGEHVAVFMDDPQQDVLVTRATWMRISTRTSEYLRSLVAALAAEDHASRAASLVAWALSGLDHTETFGEGIQYLCPTPERGFAQPRLHERLEDYEVPHRVLNWLNAEATVKIKEYLRLSPAFTITEAAALRSLLATEPGFVSAVLAEHVSHFTEMPSPIAEYYIALRGLATHEPRRRQSAQRGLDALAASIAESNPWPARDRRVMNALGAGD